LSPISGDNSRCNSDANTDDVLSVSRWARSIRIVETSLLSRDRSMPLMTSALFSRAASAAATRSDEVSDRV